MKSFQDIISLWLRVQETQIWLVAKEQINFEDQPSK